MVMLQVFPFKIMLFCMIINTFLYTIFKFVSYSGWI